MLNLSQFWSDFWRSRFPCGLTKCHHPFSTTSFTCFDLTFSHIFFLFLSGVGDGCDNCLAAPKLWADLEAIEAGFPHDRTLETIRDTYENLKKNGRGEIMKVTGDYDVRQGVCGEPVTLRETFSFTLTHKVL